jgi:hypothetical protein
MDRHDRTYTVLLIVLAFFDVTSLVTMTSMIQSPAVKPESRWVFVMTAWIEGVYLAAMVVTLVLRGTAPGAGRIATKALNVVMLALIPFGTALGIYGLLKVDKEVDAAGTSNPTITPALIAEAKRQPNGWVYAIDGVSDPNGAVPPERIRGAWKVDANGEIKGDFIPNPDYRPIGGATRGDRAAGAVEDGGKAVGAGGA